MQISSYLIKFRKVVPLQNSRKYILEDKLLFFLHTTYYIFNLNRFHVKAIIKSAIINIASISSTAMPIIEAETNR